MAPMAGELLSQFPVKLPATIGAIVVALFFARRFTVPLRQVRDHALALGRGELGALLEVAGPDEFRDMEKAFTRMAREAQAREEVLQRYQLLSKHARDMILFLRRDGRVIEGNDAAVDAYGYQREELLALKIGELRAPTSLPTIVSWGTEAEPESVFFERVARRKDGSTFPVEVASQGAMFGEERVFLSIARDITERKRTAEELQRRADAAALAADVGVALTEGESLRQGLPR